MTLALIRKELKNGGDILETISTYIGRLEDADMISSLGLDKKWIKALRSKREADKKALLKEQYREYTATKVSFRHFMEHKSELYAYARKKELGAKWSYKRYQQIVAKADKLAKRFVNTLYSMGSEIEIEVDGIIVAIHDTTESYSRRCRYTPTHGYTDIELTSREILSLEEIEGVYTIRLDDNRAKWLEVSYGRGKEEYVSLVSGYLVGTSHGETLKEARNLNRKKIVTEGRKANEIRDFREKAKKFFIGTEKLREIGACSVGIATAIKRLDIPANIGGIRCDYVLELAEKKNVGNVEGWVRRYIQSIS